MRYILAIDQSTSATKALLFDEHGQCLDRVAEEHQQFYPQPGWVEHDAEQIWQNVLSTTRRLIERNPDRRQDLACLSITNQRETIVVFERATGRPLYPAIVWQCRRSDAICAAHNDAGHGELVHARTGLRIDAYFSASKLQWLVQERPELLNLLENGEALIGTIDTYLIYRLTEGEVFATDPTNASRTLLFDIEKLRWDEELCELWGVPMVALASVRESESQFGETTLGGCLSVACPINGVMGDSQASMFAQRCFEPGSAKVTFGTGSSVLLNIGNTLRFSDQGVVTTLGWVRNGTPVYAFEGIIITSAATLNWLQKQLGLVKSVDEIQSLAAELDDAGGVYLVPAFAGLGLPYWSPDARAAIVGLSAHSDRRHVARAALESMAYQLRDALEAMQRESGVALRILKADGGPTQNDLLMQLTADLAETEVAVANAPDCSALGATLMGLLGVGIYKSLDDIASGNRNDRLFSPLMPTSEVRSHLGGWSRAVQQVLSGVNK